MKPEQAQTHRRKPQEGTHGADGGSLRAIDATRAPVVRVDTPQRAAELVEVWAWYVWRDYWRPFRKLETPEFIKGLPFPV